MNDCCASSPSPGKAGISTPATPPSFAVRPGVTFPDWSVVRSPAVRDALQAMVGYQAAPPYGALTIVGSGGVLVELEADKALSLSPVTAAEAGAMLASTRLGKTLGGYRNLIPVTDTTPLAGLVANLSALAADFCDLVPECDLNPVLIRKGSGDVRVVDALFVAGGR